MNLSGSGGFAIAAVILLAIGCGEREASAPNLSASSIARADADLIARLDSANATLRDDTELAVPLYTALLDDARARGDSFVETEALTRLAVAHWYLGDLGEAGSYATESLTLKQAYGLTDSLFRSYNTMGLIGWDRGELGASAAYFDTAAAEAERLDAPVLRAAAIGNRGLIEHDLGDFERARDAFRTLLDAGRAFNVPAYEANGLTNLGMLSISTGDPAAALSFLDTAVTIYRREGSPDEQTAMALRYKAYMDLGQPAEAFRALTGAIAQARASGYADEEARNLEALADYYHQGGDLVRARAVYDSALAQYDALGLAVEAGAVQRAIGEIFLTLGDPALALSSLDAAIRRHESAGDRFEIFLDELTLADAQSMAADSYHATLDRARAIASGIDAPAFWIALALAEARIADREHDYEQLVSILTPFERGDIPVTAPVAQAEIDALLSRAYDALGREDRAIERARSAVEAVEMVREGFASSFFRTSFVATRAAIYGRLADLLLRAGDVAGAFEILDAARGRALLEHAVRRPAESPTTTPTTVARLREAEALRRSIRELTHRVIESEAEIFNERNRPEESRLSAEIDRLRTQYEALLLQAVEEDRLGTSLLGQQPVTLDDVQQALGRNEAVVEYFITDGQVLMLWITADSAGAMRRDVATSVLRSKVRVARELLASADAQPNAYEPVLVDLYALLIQPVQSQLPSTVRRLVIVPHTFLNYLPFAALREPTGRYLIESYELILLPTASALWAIRERRSGTAAVVSGRAVAFAPLDRQLPATRDEVHAIDDALRQVDVRRGRRATERAFREALFSSEIVHAATHATLNMRNPLFSYIELAPRRRPNAEDDGFLELHEVLELDIRASLVFLSGCETGVGTAWTTRFAPGEDYATLAQAFLYAGAGNVIATLWRIEDAGAARFTATFYERLVGRDPAAALAAAQRAAIDSDDLSAPYQWAPYTVSGGAGFVSN